MINNLADVSPKIWRHAKIISTEKLSKDPHLAASYRPISPVHY